MHSSRHFASRDSAGEFLWAVCGSDGGFEVPDLRSGSAKLTMPASSLTAEIGYGNAAGFLFQKGISAPPSGQIQDIPERSTTPPLDQSSSSSSSPSGIPRHPISGLSEPLPKSSDVLMTPDERLYEAERLFTLFERMKKNPVIQLTPEDPANPGQSKDVSELMRDKLASGELEERDAQEEAEERKQQEAQDERDEYEVRRDMELYRRRMKKLNRNLAIAEQAQATEARERSAETGRATEIEVEMLGDAQKQEEGQ
jgi:hypothetical protein